MDVGQDFRVWFQNINDIFIGASKEIGEISTERCPGCERCAAVRGSKEANTASVVQDGLKVGFGAIFGFEK